MTTPTISAALTSDDIPPGPLSEDDLRQRWNQQADKYNQWESLDSCEQLAWAQALAIRADRHAAALKAKPAEQRPTDEDLYDLAAEFNGDPVPAMRGALELWGNPLQGAPEPGENLATPSAPPPQTPPTDDAWRELVSEIARVQHVAAGEGQGARFDLAKAVELWRHPAAPPEPETLAARPLLERVAKLGDVIGRQTVAQVQQLANQAAVWLRENPPGQLVAIEPRGCPTPGACSCVEPTLQAPEPGEAKELHSSWYLIEFLEGHSSVLRRTDPMDELAQVLSDSATLIKRLASPAYLVVGRPPEGCLESLKSESGQVEACTAGVSIELLGDAPRPTYLDAIRLAEGCHDYSGGYSGPEGDAWHNAINTVVDVLKRAAVKPWDSQTRAVFGVGAEAQDVEA